jgi:hypothetical protein
MLDRPCQPLPHEGVFARLRVSKIAGVGVFAIRAIPAGTNIFGNDQRSLTWVDAAVVDHLPDTSPDKSLYDDFGVRRGEHIGCPANFNLLTVGWYLNEPPEGRSANVRVTQDFQMIAVRDIAEGEELTILYDSFSETDE